MALALRAFKRQRGAYPATLAELQATLDWNLPLDPFSGKDFVYRPEGRGFTLYSIGPNLADEHGKRPEARPGDCRSGDIVWQCEK